MVSRKRGRLFVDKDVQRALVWQLVRHWVVYLAILSGILIALEWLQAGPQYPLRTLAAAVWNRYGILFVGVAALMPAFVYDAIKLSHRFVGPMVRVRRALRELACGESIEPIVFRKRDFWQDVAANLNAVSERLAEHSGEFDAEAKEQLEPCTSGAEG
jgi:hypothetical protein